MLNSGELKKNFQMIKSKNYLTYNLFQQNNLFYN